MFDNLQVLLLLEGIFVSLDRGDGGSISCQLSSVVGQNPDRPFDNNNCALPQLYIAAVKPDRPVLYKLEKNSSGGDLALARNRVSD